jgi:hypothetical protein
MTRLYRLADFVAVGCAALSLLVFLLGGFVLYIGPVAIRLHGAGRILFVAAALTAIRHAAHPADPLHRRVARLLRSGGDSLPAIASLALISRVAALAVGYFAVVTVGLSLPEVGFSASSDPMVNLPARFDAGWYAGIALDGYRFEGRFDRQQNLAFFPAFPMLERVIGYPFGAFTPGVPEERRGARLLWGGVVISLAAFAWAAVYFWRLAREMLDAERAWTAVAFLAAYPFSVFFSAAYSESLFLLGVVAAFYHFRRDDYAASAGWGLLVGLTRPNGFLLSLVLAVLIFEKWLAATRRASHPAQSTPHPPQSTPHPALSTWHRALGVQLLAASAPGIGMLLYSAYVKHLTGAWFGWMRLHEAWGRSYSGLAPLERAYGWIAEEGVPNVVRYVPYDTLNSLAVIFALLMLWPVIRRTGLACAVFVVVILVPPLLAGGVLSMGRVTATVFPLFLALAAIVPPRAVLPLVTAFAMGQGLAAVLFFTWRPLF